MPVTDLSEYRTNKIEEHLRERPSQVLPMTGELYDAVSVDTETSGLHCDDGATVAAVSVAYRLKAEPDVIWHHAFAFDQGRAQDKGFEEVLYADTPGNHKMKMADGTTRDVVGLSKGDPLGMWDWHTDYNLPGDEWRALMRWLISAGQAVTLSNANIKFDLHHLKHGTRHFEGVELEKYARWDTQLTSAELWPGESTALKNTGIRLWGEEVAAEAAVVKACLIEVKKRYGLTSVHGPRYDLMPWEVNGPYASQDTVLALRLRETQIQMLDDGLGSWRHVDQAHDLMRVLYRMEARRFGPIDIELALHEADRIQKRMDELAPAFPFQPPTPAQATEYFFVDLGLRPWKTELGEQAREVSIVPDKRKGAPVGATRVKIDHYGSLTEKIADRMADADVEHAREYAEFLRLQNANQMFYRNYANLAGPEDRLMTNFKQAFVKSGRMALPLTARVLTPRGWATMGALGTGSQVIGSDGRPAWVTAVPFRGQAQIYRVRISDGTEVECSDNHLWSYREHGSRDRTKIRTSTTASLLPRVARGRAFHLPDLQPVEYRYQHVPVDPYLLGVLLGNGSLTRSPRFSVFEEDADIAGRVAKRTKDEVRRHADRTDKSIRYGLVGGWTEKGLRKLGLLDTVAATKFVPDQYLIGSIDQRYALLRGLMDTDGYVDNRNGNARYDTASEALAFAVRDLVLSLGGVANIQQRKTLCEHNGPGPYYMVYISSREAPVSSDRKLVKWRKPSRFPRRIVSIEALDESAQMQCITVDAPDQLFVTEGYVLTHNSVERFQAQAIPKKLKLSILGEPVTEPRGLFLVDPGLTRINLDLKQAELRIAALMSGCQSMLDQLLAGVDFHTNTTKRVFGIDETDPDWSLTRDIGKRLAQTVDTPIPVPGGWKRAGDIQVDDVIYGRRGLTTVTGVHPQGRIPCYRVTMGDKRYLDVSDQHLWYTLHTTVADCTKRDIRKTKVQTTLELAEEVRRAETDRYRYPHGRGSARGYVSIPFTEPVPGVYRDLPADPYLLGLWLGDGSRTKKRPEVAIAFDPQDYDHYVNVFGPPRRIDAGRVLVYNWAGQGIGRPAGAGVTSPMLRDIWLNHMPEYETADTKQRLALLQGLMDSDGSCSHGTKARRGGSFCNTDRAKADLVVKLVQSLGGYCQVNSIQPKGPRGNAQLAWMVQVFTPEGINPFLLPRKADIYKSMARKMLRVVSVERLPEDQEMVCYTVDAPDSLYLAGDYLVTHNTFSSVFLIGPKSFREQLWLKGGVEYSWQQSCDAVYGWRNTYPEFKIAYDYWAGHFEKHGHVILIDGQPSWLGPRDWPHTGWSRVVQSSLALFVRDWLIRIERMTAKYNALTLTVHDSVNLDLPEQVADQVAADIIEMSEELWLQWFGIPGGVERGSFAKG